MQRVVRSHRVYQLLDSPHSVHTASFRDCSTPSIPSQSSVKHLHRSFEQVILLSFLSLCTPYSPHMYENGLFWCKVTFLQNRVSRAETRGSTVLRRVSADGFSTFEYTKRYKLRNRTKYRSCISNYTSIGGGLKIVTIFLLVF